MKRYTDRRAAGKILAAQLSAYKNKKDVFVLALPRGGVPVAYEIATSLHAPLDVFIVRKLGVPGQGELAMGAMAMGGIKIFNDEIIKSLHISSDDIAKVIEKEQEEMQRRELKYRGHHTFPPLKEKTIILVDDGMATGASMRAAIKALHLLKPAHIIVAVPVADQEVCEQIPPLVNQLICPLQPAHLNAVGAWYDDFTQTEDEEVRQLLTRARRLS